MKTAETQRPATLKTSIRGSLLTWLRNDSAAPPEGEGRSDEVDWLRVVPYLALHVLCLLVFVVGVSPIAVITMALLYVVRMFAITGFYHRYFSHRSFKTSRVGQFIFAVLGAAAVQRGPIWWAAHHRHHHAHSDQELDIHSPVQRSFFWSHTGWFLSRRHYAPDLSRVRDLLRFPELKLLDRYDVLVPTALGVGLFLLGVALQHWAPQLQTTGWQMLVWGFFVSTVLCYHATYTINSLCHRFGRQRYKTNDGSRNNLWLALLTLGEGWHNNHHHYPASARQGFFWWEIDITYYGLRLLSMFGIIWDLKPVPAQVRAGIDRREVANTAIASGTRKSAVDPTAASPPSTAKQQAS